MNTAAIFSDNMVLQRHRNVRIFGQCEAGEDIRADIPELGISVKAAVTGEDWVAVLPPMEACAECTVEISSASDKITFKNVAVGEVWLAGGQSNMEFELQNDKNGTQTLAECSGENVRFYYTPKCEMADEKLLKAETESCWALPSSEDSRCWSAVGYYFARELSRSLGVTVGVIGCNWGGTSASAWINRCYLEQDSRLRPYIDEYDEACAGKTVPEMIAEYDEYVAYHTAWEKRMQRCYQERPDIEWSEVLEICGENRYPGPMGCKNPMRPCGLYETMISRVRPYTIAGVLYYQGESDDHRPDTYYSLLTALIDCWRSEWLDDELPFLLVQLPMFKYTADPDYKHWCKIRQAQLKAYKTIKNTGIAVALDCGEFNNIHPVDKEPVGHRLYLQAMCEVYGLMSRKEALPPVFREFTDCTGGRLVLRFDNCEGFDLRGELTGFEAAGTDGDFVSVCAHIEEDIIVLEGAPSPTISVRYKWTNYAGVELYGKNGIPVPPFSSVNSAPSQRTHLSEL